MRVVASAVMVLLAGAVPSSVAAQSPQFRGDPAHLTTVDARGLDRLGGVAWRLETGGAVRSTPALADGTLYVGSSDGNLYALSAAGGEERWRFHAGSAVVSSPAVTEGVVLVGSRDGVLHGVERASGRSLWRLEARDSLPLPWGHEGFDYFHASATLAAGVAYWGSHDGVLHAVDPATGDERWRFRTGGRIRSTPAVAGDLLVLASGDGYVYALDAATGSERWRFETAGARLQGGDFGYDRRQIFSSPVVFDGVIYVGSRDASLYALDARDGTELWSVDEESAWVVGTPVVTPDRVYSVRSSSGNVRAIDRATGEELWLHTAPTSIHSSPVLAGGVLHVGLNDGHLVALEAATGEVLWRYRTGGGIRSTPVVHDGRLYVGSDDGYVYAFAAADGEALRRAVYYDEELSSRATTSDERARDFFVGRGYELLDGPALDAFLEGRARDRAPSVVVFAMDALPGDADLLLRYLRADGKAVWLGYLPEYVVRDPGTGAITGTDRDASAGLLGVDLSAYDGDAFSTWPTDAGRRWGLGSWWVGQGTTRARHVTQALAEDELGRAVAWVQGFGGPSGTGFVHLRLMPDGPSLPEILRVAEYGLAGVSGR